jgi:epoxyqueuosine reductase
VKPGEKYTRIIKAEAQRLGFSHCGISRADFLEDHAAHLEAWLNKGMHGSMRYMESHFDERLDPRKLVPGAKSVISFLLNYFPSREQSDPLAPRISKYAYGKDYHLVIREKLKALLHFIRETIGEVNGRGFVDSAPVLDKAWAMRSGLGWMGKNANLISKGNGSFFFVAELIVDLELEPDGPVTDHCGTCTACLDACPTQAIVSPRMVDGSKCISYFTIELKEQIPADMKGKFDNWVFGCDVCQDVCPWNRFSKPHREPQLAPSEELMGMTKRDWEEITEEVFRNVFRDSAVKRTKFAGLKRNVEFLKGE